MGIRMVQPPSSEAVRRALRWARWLHWLLVLLVGFLLLSILQLGTRVQIQKGRDRRARQLLLVEEARSLRLSRVPGWETAALERLQRARALDSDLTLRDEVAAWLTESETPGRPPVRTRLGGGAQAGLDRVAWPRTGSHVGAAGSADGWAWRVLEEGGFGAPVRVPPDRVPPDPAGPVLVGSGIRLEPVAGPFLQLVAIADGGPVVRLPLPGRGAALSVAASPDGRWLAAVPGDGSGVDVWDLVALRAALGEWNLDWPADEPSRRPPPAVGPEISRNERRVLSGLGLVLLVAAMAIASQYVLLVRYRRAEHSAAAHAEELQRARESLAHADKMRALGTLAAGVAHDFNNLLSVIQMSRQLIERSGPAEGAVREHLGNIGQAVNQGRSVVRTLLGHTRDPVSQPAPIPFDRFLPEILSLVRHPFLDGIDVRLVVAPGLPSPPVRRGRLEQVLLNIVVNAAESMGGRGVLSVTARPASAAGECVLAPRDGGPWVEIEVGDSGPGIAPEILPRIFEPFFSTKAAGTAHGTGLGLATVWRIAEEEGYGLRVAPNFPGGTRFTVLIPVGSPAAPSP